MINTEKCRELLDHYIVYLTLTLYVNYTGEKNTNRVGGFEKHTLHLGKGSFSSSPHYSSWAH